MESRTILVIDPATNAKVTLNTDATTFGELKQALADSGASIDITNKDWLEGITKTVPASDDSLLPTGVSYKGQTTNNLVYLLSNTNKKTKSGMDRKELGNLVKSLGIGEALKKKYGKNWTNISTPILVEETTKAQKKSAKTQSTEKPAPKKETSKSTPKKETKPFDGVAELNKEIKKSEESVDYKKHYDVLKAKYDELIGVVAQFKNVLDNIQSAEILMALDSIQKTKPVNINFSEDELADMMRK